MVEKKKRLIDDLLQDDFFGIRKEKESKKEEATEKVEEIIEEAPTVEETQPARPSEEATQALFDEELMEEKTEEGERKALSEVETPQELQEISPLVQKSKKGILIIVLLVLLLLGGGGSAYFFLLSPTKPFSKKTPQKKVKVTKKITLKKSVTSPVPTKVKEAKTKPAPVTTPAVTSSSTVVTKKQIKKTTVISPQQPKRIVPHPTPPHLPKKVKPVKKIAIVVPKYAIKAGPFPNIKSLKQAEAEIKKIGYEVQAEENIKNINLLYVNLGTMDQSRATALKLKIEIFMPDQKNKIMTNSSQNNVTVMLGPYSSATEANSIIARLQTPKLGINGKLFSKTKKVTEYYLSVGKFPDRESAKKIINLLKQKGIKGTITGL